jgi:hypothetical protein
LEAAANEHDDLVASLAAARAEIEKMQDMKLKMIELREASLIEKATYESTIEGLMARNKELESVSTEFVAKCTIANRNIAVVSVEKQVLQARLDNQDVKIAQLEKELVEEKRLVLAEQQKAIAFLPLARKLEGSRKANVTLQEQFSALSVQHDSLLANFVELKSEKAALEEKLTNERSLLIANFNNEAQAKEKKFDDLRKQHDSILRELDEKHIELENHKGSLLKTLSSSNALADECDSTVQQLQDLTRKYDKISLQYHSLFAKNETLSDHHEALNRELKQLQEEHNCLLGKHALLISRYDELKGLQSKHEDLTVIHEDVRLAKDELTSVNQDLDSRRHKLAQEFQKQSMHLIEVESNLAALSSKHNITQEQLATISLQLHDALAKVEHQDSEHALLISECERLDAQIRRLEDDKKLSSSLEYVGHSSEADREQVAVTLRFPNLTMDGWNENKALYDASFLRGLSYSLRAPIEDLSEVTVQAGSVIATAKVLTSKPTSEIQQSVSESKEMFSFVPLANAAFDPPACQPVIVSPTHSTEPTSRWERDIAEVRAQLSSSQLQQLHDQQFRSGLLTQMEALDREHQKTIAELSMVKQELFLSQQRAQNTVEVAASKTDVNKAPVAASKTDANKAHVAASASALHVSNSSVKKSSGTQSEVKLAESKLIGAAVMEVIRVNITIRYILF